MRTNRKLHFTLFILIFCFIGDLIVNNPSKAIFDPSLREFKTDATNHELQILDFSHNKRIIYANYSIVNITVLFTGPEVNLSKIVAYYSHNTLSWENREFTRANTVSTYSAVFSVAIGPFTRDGNYYLKINATRFSIEHAIITYRFQVTKVAGIVFTDFSYKIKIESDGNQYADIMINVLGDDIKLGSVYVSSEQQELEDPPFKLNLKVGTNTSYVRILGPINSWASLSRVTFTANTSVDVQYYNSAFFLIKAKVYKPEDFWTGKFPVIVLGGIVIISMTIIFIMAKRKPPSNY